jgi:hypothetical protein
MKAIPKILVALPLFFAVPKQAAAEGVTIHAPPEAKIRLLRRRPAALGPSGIRLRPSVQVQRVRQAGGEGRQVSVDRRHECGDGRLLRWRGRGDVSSLCGCVWNCGGDRE